VIVKIKIHAWNAAPTSNILFILVLYMMENVLTFVLLVCSKKKNNAFLAIKSVKAVMTQILV